MTVNGIDTERDDEQGFSESWLTLREPVDHAARSGILDAKLAHWCRQKTALSVVELGAGTGSNLRYLLPLLGHHQSWLLVDNDAVLLDRLPELLQPWADRHAAALLADAGTLFIESTTFSARIDTKVIDLATSLELLPMQGVNLLTASALLDLTSASWINQLAQMAATHRSACLFALNYNGKIQWQPDAPSDTNVTALLNQHQLGDKGFGPALGPHAGEHLAQALKRHGRLVDTAESDWNLDKKNATLQQAIIEGWAPAAKDQEAGASSLIDEWFTTRQKWIEHGTSTLSVGHLDVLSLP